MNFLQQNPMYLDSHEMYLPGGIKRSQDPINTGTSVIGLTFDGGVVLAADTLASYGSMARYTDCPRVVKINENCIMGASGDMGDFQYVLNMIKLRVIEDECAADGVSLKPKALYNWLTHMMYRRRSKFDPLWNEFVVAGIQDGEPYLGVVDKLGTAYSDPIISTGFGAHLATPLLRKAYDVAKATNGSLTQEVAVDVVKKCLEVLYYRDARSWPKYILAVITKDGVDISPPVVIPSNWQVAHLISGYE